jgi:hypothetical protein
MMCGRLAIRELETFGHLGVGLQIALRREDMDRLDARPHEDGDVVVVSEDLSFGQRKCERNGHQSRKTCGAARCGYPTSHAPRVDAPKQHEHRDRDRSRDKPDDADLRQYRPQERHGVRIDDHQVHEVRGHPEDMMLEARNPDDRCEDRERQACGDRRPAQ